MTKSNLSEINHFTIGMLYQDLTKEQKSHALKSVHAILAIGFSTNKTEIAKKLGCDEKIAASLLNEFAAKGILEKVVVIPNRTIRQNLRYIYRLKRPRESNQ